MSDIAIRVEGLSKRYKLGQRERYKALRDTITNAFSAPIKGIVSRKNHQKKDVDNPPSFIWALNDVSFEIKKGEVVGVIGRNGAGKSTLLKILSRITKPTRGTADIYGRVGSLLEVGTGFHPELTGRENIFLNGAILGMKRVEIDRKFDEIVDFSEIEQFLDTPVKFYSSGMYMRLAFSVAAHLDPEILLVDEVLAVGDAEFQRKCLGKMGDVAKSGRTVLFVSHNMAAIEALCEKCLVLSTGELKYYGTTPEAVSCYLKELNSKHLSTDLNFYRIKTGNTGPVIQKIEFINRTAESVSSYKLGETITLKLDIYSKDIVENPNIGIGINNSKGLRILTLSTRLQGIQLPPLTGYKSILCTVKNLPLAPDQYYLKITFGDLNHDFEVLDGIPGFEIVQSNFLGSGKLPSKVQGIIISPAIWEIG